MDNTKKIYAVPKLFAERNHLRKLIGDFVNKSAIVPPVSLENLHGLSDQLMQYHSIDQGMKGWLMVEINNCIWKETVSSIPYDKRILLLPKCLNNAAKCKADMDEFGLLCHRCNSCLIPDLQDKAEELGMMSIVAEGFTSVIGLIKNRVVDAVIGVSCLESLEKAFPLLVNNAVPGLAIPLNEAGCKDTTVDYSYVEQMMGMLSENEIELLDHEGLKAIVQEWFSDGQLKHNLALSNDHASRLALEWLGGNGKRWRPYLLAAVYQTLAEAEKIPGEVRKAAIAVECFHKASLIHDDIEDNDAKRYGEETLHTVHGVPVAINVGDILLGEGYRLLTEGDNMALVKVIAEAHISLCKGQGMELEWSLSPRPLEMPFVLEIFKNKTVPAFDVSLQMGLICAGIENGLRDILHDYSHALGIAYQLFDDIEDFESDTPIILRPSAILAVLCGHAPHASFMDALMRSKDLKAFLNRPENKTLLEGAMLEVKRMAEGYRKKAIDILDDITNVELKRLLFRITKRILK